MTNEKHPDPATSAPPEHAPPEHAPPEHHFDEGEEAPPRGVHAMAIVRWCLLAAMVLAALASVYVYVRPLVGQPAGEQRAAKYYCPMHPQITSDVPGECPICHMTLEPIPAERRHAASAAAAPPARSTAPTGSSAANAGASPMPPGVANPPEGTTPVTLALDRVQAIGVRTALVEKRKLADSLRVVASVEATEKGKAEVHFRADGYIEAIHVRELGVKVRAGELLASIYSPEIFQAQQELIAMGAWNGSDASAPPMGAARKKLELLGLGRATIDSIVRTGKPIRAVGVSSPIAGYVIAKNVVLGSRVTPDMTLFEVANLAKVYVIGRLYAHQLSSVRVGDAARFTTPDLPGRVFEAKVELVYPEVDVATRTSRVRFLIDNKDLALRPGQFGTAELTATPGEELMVPIDAVVDTGRSVYVFVAEEGGRFTPRAVELGDELGDRFVIRGGLQEGERVVSGATFLIDAESRLQASLAGHASGSAAAPADAPR